MPRAFFVLAAIATAALAGAQTTRRSPVRKPPAVAALQKIVPEANFNNDEIKDALDFLRDITGANFFIDWRSIEAGGIERSAPVSLQLRQVPASEVLRLALKSVSPEIVYEIQNGIVIVLDPNQYGPGVPMAQNLATRAYDVSDLVDSEVDNKREAKMNQLIELITSTVSATRR